MRRGVLLLVLGVVAAALGVASAHAGGAATITTSTTTTAATTTTTAPSYTPLFPSSLPAGCVGAGAAALVLPSHRVIALGTPASDLGPSAYPTSGSVFAFDSSSASGTTCKAQVVTLGSVSLFGGAVTASSVQARDGKGTAAGVEINGAPVAATAGETVPVDGWAQLTLGATVGRVTAPLVLRLLQAHNGLSAGTAVVVGFAASAHPTTAKPHRQKPPQRATNSSSPKQGAGTHHSRKRAKQQSQKPPPDYPSVPSPLTADGGFTDAMQDNPIVSTALQYLGVPYQWGGASPETGFDCSGLVQYVFGQLGVPLIHYAAAQWHTPDGVWVAPNHLRPGDLVFFTGSDGTRKAPGHVGIYLDDGYIIDAPHTGTVVRIDSLNEPKLADQYVGARRIDSQLLVARHLLNATKANASGSVLPVGFPPPVTLAPVGESLTTAGADTATVRTTQRVHWMWAGAGLCGALLLLATGGLLVRRRRSPDARPSGEAST